MLETIDKNDYLPKNIKAKTLKIVIITIGDDEASKVYLKNKRKVCNDLGIRVIQKNIGLYQPMENATYLRPTNTSDVIETIKYYNNQEDINGIMVQLPIPKQFNTIEIINVIDPKKDIDGLTYTNIGKLEQGLDCIVPATARGIMEFFEHVGIELEGKKVLIIGRSQLVGRPLQKLLLEKNAIPTITHSYDITLEHEIKNYDIVISAIGQPGFIKAQHVTRDQILIDVGISKVDGKIVGDITDSAKKKALLGTAVPKGIGVLTTVCFAKNCLELKLWGDKVGNYQKYD